MQSALLAGLVVLSALVVVATRLLGDDGGPAFDVDDRFGDRLQVAGPRGDAPPPERRAGQSVREFSAGLLADVQNTWRGAFQRSAPSYERAGLVLYRTRSATGCGEISWAVGPIYCPNDRRFYLSARFYRDLSTRLGAQGDFAWAYAIAHELGHHVQHQLGTDDRIARLRADRPRDAGALLVRSELQADCYAGVWAHGVYGAGELEAADIERSVTASQAAGEYSTASTDDDLVDREKLTHGSVAQRIKWFTIGHEHGRPADCDSFSPQRP